MIRGASDFKTVVKDKLSKAANRDLPMVEIWINSQWNKSQGALNNVVTVKNYGNETYKGSLRVYVTEINSRWSDYNGNPYKFAFLDYALKKEIEVKPFENKTFSQKWDPDKAGFKNIEAENLWVIAVLFNSEGKQGFAYPSEKKNPFTAYYADASTAIRVKEGKLPPSIGIKVPKKNSHYILGNEKHNKYIKKTYVIGRITLEVNIEAESGVEKVEYLIKGPFKDYNETVSKSPYSLVFKKFAFGKYTITARVYDKDGRTASDSIETWMFIL